MGAGGIIDDEFELIMEGLDVNGDGLLDYNEFLQATIDH
jgi:Ca2+-binding EF-hand superfamily protein